MTDNVASIALCTASYQKFLSLASSFYTFWFGIPLCSLDYFYNVSIYKILLSNIDHSELDLNFTFFSYLFEFFFLTIPVALFLCIL